MGGRRWQIREGKLGENYPDTFVSMGDLPRYRSMPNGGGGGGGSTAEDAGNQTMTIVTDTSKSALKLFICA